MNLNRTGAGKKLLNQVVSQNKDVLKKYAQPKKQEVNNNNKKTPKNT
jgi:hypothetical protein